MLSLWVYLFLRGRLCSLSWFLLPTSSSLGTGCCCLVLTTMTGCAMGLVWDFPFHGWHRSVALRLISSQPVGVRCKYSCLGAVDVNEAVIGVGSGGCQWRQCAACMAFLLLLPRWLIRPHFSFVDCFRFGVNLMFAGAFVADVMLVAHTSV